MLQYRCHNQHVYVVRHIYMNNNNEYVTQAVWPPSNFPWDHGEWGHCLMRRLDYCNNVLFAVTAVHLRPSRLSSTPLIGWQVTLNT